MREILFRGKRKDNGKWLQGSLFAEENRVEIVRSTCNNVGIEGADVCPETVGQYTGLTDKNGTKIFEGDIVTSDYYFKKNKSKNSVIEYGEWNCSCCNGVFGWVSNGLVDFRDEDVIVIGNIHDNPELIPNNC